MLKLHFECQEDFTDLMSEGYEELSIQIVETILKNIDADNEEFQIAKITFDESDNIFEIYVEPRDYVITLEQNLWVFEDLEDYEMCSRIRDAIEYLEEK